MTRSIVGRDAELARIEAFLDHGPTGPRIGLIEGPPGVGKTTVWLAALERAASGWRVLQARPTDAEATFAYAGVGDLLESVPDSALAGLPDPQRKAIRVALLRAEPEGRNPDPRAVAVAFLNTLRSLSIERPIVVAVDDLQWLDGPSAEALRFAIRRADDGAIRFLVARRTDQHEDLGSGLERVLADLPSERLELGPMGLEATAALLSTRLDHRFARSTLRRIHAGSGGNPLFAIELARAILQAPSSDIAGRDVPMPRSLLDLIGMPIGALPDATRHAVAVVALLASPTLKLVADATGAPAEEALREAIDTHIVDLQGDRVRFVHPLHAVAVRSGLTPEAQREIHARLAQIVPDPELRARHLALAAVRPDEPVAAALEDAARRARARGAPDAAADLASMARRLTPPERTEDMARRGLLEGWGLLLTGDYEQVRGLAERLLSGPLETDQRWVGRSLQAMVYCMAFDLEKGAALYREAIADIGEDDARRLTWEGGMTFALDLLGNDYREALAHGYAELELADRFGDEIRMIGALRGIARNEQRLTGRMPVDLIDRAVAREPTVREVREVVGWPSYCLAEMLTWTDDLEGALAKWTWLSGEAAARGESHSLIDIHSRMVLCEIALGRLEDALRHATEGSELARENGARVFEAILVAEHALVEAYRGNVEAVRREAATATVLAAAGNPPADRMVAWAMGFLELSLGNGSGAHEHLGPLVASRRAAGVAEPGEMRFVTDEVEALIGTGRFDDAETLLAWYEGLAEASGRVGALAASARSRGLLLGARGDIEPALEALAGSVELYERGSEPLGLARSLMAFGALERRRLHKRAARELLGAALVGFETIGAQLWAGAARGELRRIGGRVASPDALTPTEERVASLVSEGRTNREVAAILVVSERTVEGHLSRIYAKIGVRSRAELAHRLTVDPAPRA